MQREDVDRLAHYAAMLGIPLGDEHAALRDHHEAVAATLRALLAERDAAFAAGQREMQERAVEVAQEKHDLALKFLAQYLKDYEGNTDSLIIANQIRALPIKDSPDGR